MKRNITIGSGLLLASMMLLLTSQPGCQRTSHGTAPEKPTKVAGLSDSLVVKNMEPLALGAPQFTGYSDDFYKDFAAFVAEPTKENHRKVYDRVVQHESYNPYGDDLHDLEAAFDAERYEDVIKSQAVPSVILSPRFHLIMARAAEKEGLEDAMALEQQAFVACVDGILASGDGTIDNPYLVTAVADEYDIVYHLGTKTKGQDLLDYKGRSIDKLTLDDGTYLYFDVTAGMEALARLLGGSKK